MSNLCGGNLDDYCIIQVLVLVHIIYKAMLKDVSQDINTGIGKLYSNKTVCILRHRHILKCRHVCVPGKLQLPANVTPQEVGTVNSP